MTINLDRGFTLTESDDHVVILKHEGVQVAIFNQTQARAEDIYAEVTKHLSDNHRNN